MATEKAQISTLKAVQKNDIDTAKSTSKPLSATAQKRQELAVFLNRSGRGLQCRLDISILTVEDIKRAAFELDRLAKSLQKIVENPDQNDVLQVLSARHEFTKTKFQIKSFNVN